MSTSHKVAAVRLGDRLGALRDKYFVGRTAELDLFRSALQHDPVDRPVALFFLHGPGGVGKSVLLRQFGRSASNAGATVVTLDGRDFEPSPAGFLGALRAALQLDGTASPLDVLADPSLQPVLLIDTCEVLAPLDTWLRELFLPQLPDRSLVVLAGRNPPSIAWRADPAWSELAQVVPLRNLLPSDSRAYLHARGLPEEQHAAVLEFTHGHPLALSLLTNLLIGDDSRTFRPEHAPDVVRSLLERFVEAVPSQAHWRALAVCAHARVTTEPMLGAVLGRAEAPMLFDWLRDLPFVEHGPLGLFPHDVAREVLDADLRWRDPATYRDLHARIRDALVEGLRASRVLEHQGAYFDFLYLARHGAISKAYYDWASFGHQWAEVAVPADHAEILALTCRHEGEASARIAEYWLAHQPRAFVVFREASQRLAGFATQLVLDHVTADDAAVDPGVAAAWRFVAQRTPLRPGERIMHHRFFVGRDAYQDTATHNMVAMVATLRWLTTPRLALSFAIVAEPERWAPMFEAIRFPRTPAADFEVGGHRYGAFVHDWRVDPIEGWIDVKTALDPRTQEAEAGREGAPPPLEVLSQPDFEAAVRQALRDYNRPALASNPLLRSRLAFEHAHGQPGPTSLRALIVETADELRASPGSRTEKLYRALACTYLEPAATQELAAERLGLPFNTYRYQLAAAIKRVSGSLWQRELHSDGA
jgi:AAA ATPase domain